MDNITVDGITLELGSAPVKDKPKSTNAAPYLPGVITEDSAIETFDSLTEEQKLYYSVTT